MKRYSHNPINIVIEIFKKPIGKEEGLLDSIPVMNIYVNVEHPRMYPQQFQYAYNNVIDVAKSTCLSLLGVMQATRPIDSNISLITEDCMG